VLYLGQVVEEGETALLLGTPAHPYTQALRAAVPDLETGLPTPAPRPQPVDAGGDHAPDDDGAARLHRDHPGGCPFHPRCPLAVDRCRAERPPLREVAGRRVACHRAEEALASPTVAVGSDTAD
jgi:oligopeptide/dipeptide ABC transporter ATP-binding protein